MATLKQHLLCASQRGDRLHSTAIARQSYVLLADSIPRGKSIPAHRTRALVAARQIHVQSRRLPTYIAPARPTITESYQVIRPNVRAAIRRNMSDADYAAFLDKANQNTGGATAKSQSEYTTKSVNTAVPKVLESVEEYYVSDADEPFEPVALSYTGDSISAQQLKTLLSHNAQVKEISVKEFDPRGQYSKVVDAVKEAGNGKVQVFSVEHSGTRVEYYVVSVDGKDKKVVGLKALSVES